ncbi:MAG: type IX secretion system membrane protein PorP/SprF [Bacteroidales bacterium]
MKRLALLFFALLSITAFGQRDALYSQYMFNQLVINPAYSGSKEEMSLAVFNRNQWVGLDGAPRTFTVSAHTPLRNEHVALGMYVYADRIGADNDLGVVGSYAYRVRLGAGKLSLGLQGGISTVSIDWNKVTVHDETDAVYVSRPDNSLKPDANFGVYYYTKNYYVGLSSKHLLESQFGKVENTGSYSTLTRHFYFMGGMALPISDKIVFKPSTLIKYANNAPLNVDLNASFLFNDKIWIGTSFRTGKNAMVFMIELQATSNLRIGYSYDASMGALKAYNGGSHEIMLGYDLNLFKPRVLTPRYF